MLSQYGLDILTEAARSARVMQLVGQLLERLVNAHLDIIARRPFG